MHTEVTIDVQIRQEARWILNLQGIVDGHVATKCGSPDDIQRVAGSQRPRCADRTGNDKRLPDPDVAAKSSLTRNVDARSRLESGVELDSLCEIGGRLDDQGLGVENDPIALDIRDQLAVGIVVAHKAILDVDDVIAPVGEGTVRVGHHDEVVAPPVAHARGAEEDVVRAEVRYAAAEVDVARAPDLIRRPDGDGPIVADVGSDSNGNDVAHGTRVDAVREPHKDVVVALDVLGRHVAQGGVPVALGVVREGGRPQRHIHVARGVRRPGQGADEGAERGRVLEAGVVAKERIEVTLAAQGRDIVAHERVVKALMRKGRILADDGAVVARRADVQLKKRIILGQSEDIELVDQGDRHSLEVLSDPVSDHDSHCLLDKELRHVIIRDLSQLSLPGWSLCLCRCRGLLLLC